MMPRFAALSNSDSTADTTLASWALFAFLNSVFRRVFVSRFRSVCFSVWRTHLTAALIFGTRSSLSQIGRAGPAFGGRFGDVRVRGVAARRDPALPDRVAHGSAALGQLPEVGEPAAGRGLAHLDKEPGG